MTRHQGARRHKVGIIGERKEAGAGHCDVIGKPAMPMLAHDLHILAERLVARLAVAAFAAIGLGEENSLHAGLQPAIGRGLDDHASGLDSHHLRQRMGDPVAIVAHVEIDAIDRGGGNLEYGLARSGRGIRKIAPGHAVWATSFQNCRLHCRLPAGAGRSSCPRPSELMH